MRIGSGTRAQLSRIGALALAAGVSLGAALGASAVSAQEVDFDSFPQFTVAPSPQLDGYEPAPGYQTPDNQIREVERDAVHPFGTLDQLGYTERNPALNEIAGQRKRTDGGLLGEALGGIKDGIGETFLRSRP